MASTTSDISNSAEMLDDNGIDARQAEPILWMLLSNVYRLERIPSGIKRIMV